MKLSDLYKFETRGRKGYLYLKSEKGSGARPFIITNYPCLNPNCDQKRFTQSPWKSLGAVAKLVKSNGGQMFDSLESAVIYMNKYKKKNGRK